MGLGACGDFLGGAGVEGAWLSGQMLAARLHA
jgi:predicted NAD/FAD-dependent oxidoreductase